MGEIRQQLHIVRLPLQRRVRNLSRRSSMHRMNNERGSVFIFVTLIIVLLLIMVGLGLDTGQLAYVRSQGQAAVDAAALGAVSGLRVSTSQVENRSAGFNATNNY